MIVSFILLRKSLVYELLIVPKRGNIIMAKKKICEVIARLSTHPAKFPVIYSRKSSI